MLIYRLGDLWYSGRGINDEVQLLNLMYADDIELSGFTKALGYDVCEQEKLILTLLFHCHLTEVD